MTTTFSITKNKCFNCKKRKTISSSCKYCNNDFCISCIQQEIHLCERFADLKRQKQFDLATRLENERCVKRKIEKI